MDHLEELELENKKLRKDNISLQQRVFDQSQQIASLTEKVSHLLKKVEELSHPKTSDNSSLPPSHDIKRAIKSLRKSTGRKSGGQKGHPGITLKQISTPDKIIPLTPHSCLQCGGSLVHAEMSLFSTRQVVDIPPLTPLYTEYQQHSCTCPTVIAMKKLSILQKYRLLFSTEVVSSLW